MKRILVVEDEIQMRFGLKDNLEFEGYVVDEAADGEAALEKASEAFYDLIVLDVMLPKQSGFEVCKAIRSKGINTPILMLTAKGEEIDKVRGLEFGADDYVTKPFSLRELLARIKALLRRSPRIKEDHLQNVSIGKLTVDFSTYQAFEDNQPVHLSHKEYEILKYFLEHRNETVSRDQLLSDVWGYNAEITSRTVDNFILKLRQKIEENPAHPFNIITVHGIGYKFIV